MEKAPGDAQDVASAPSPIPGGMTVWLTGLPSAGKSTLARGVAARLAAAAMDYQILDGDEMRENLTAGLGFTREDRDTNVRRIGFVASLLSRHGTLVICPVISPYRSTRAEVRAFHAPDRFMEVYVSTPVEVCEGRDVKGLYARARSGAIRELTGVDDPYEPPEDPELVVPTHELSVEQSVELIFARLGELIG